MDTLAFLGMSGAEWKVYGFIALRVAITVALGYLVYNGIRVGLRSLQRRGRLHEQMQAMLALLLRWIIIVLVALMVLQQVGVPVAGLWASLLAVGAMVAIGFVAVWSVLSNITCAMVLVITRPFALGDEIEIIETGGGQGLRGRVMGFNMIYTVIEEAGEGGGARVMIPNNVFLQKCIRRHKTAGGKGLVREIFTQAVKGEKDEPEE